MFSEGITLWLQQFSTPILDKFFLMVTYLGSVQAYMLLLLVVYWCYNRRIGRGVILAFVGTAWLNCVLKDFMGLGRPSADIVQVMAYEWSNGFPSGHMQFATTVWGYLALHIKNRTFRVAAVLVVLMIGLSRLYLGVHFPGDVLGGFLLGLMVLAIVIFWERKRPLANMSASWRTVLFIALPLLGAMLVQSNEGFRLAGIWSALLLTDVSQHFPGADKPLSLKALIGRAVIGLPGFLIAYILIKLFIPQGLPTYLAYAAATTWVTAGAPALFRRWGLGAWPQQACNACQPLVVPAQAFALCLLLAVGAAVATTDWSSTFSVTTAGAGALPALVTNKDFLVLGHKGAEGMAPGNTLAAYAQALKAGADVLEMDVQRTKDGHVVVIHDADVTAVSEGTGEVAEMTLAQLQALDAGYRFSSDGVGYPFRGKGLRIPTLAEVLAAFPNTPVNIDMKDHSAGMPEALLAVVDQADARSRVIVASFDGPTIRAFRDLAPDIPTALAEDEMLSFVILTRVGVGAFYHPPAKYMQIPVRQGPVLLATPAMVKLAARLGMEIHVWTVNDTGTIQRLIESGVQGIVTDYPARVAQEIAQ